MCVGVCVCVLLSECVCVCVCVCVSVCVCVFLSVCDSFEFDFSKACSGLEKKVASFDCPVRGAGLGTCGIFFLKKVVFNCKKTTSANSASAQL